VKLGFLREERESYLLGLLRVCFAVLLFAQTARRALELHRSDYFGDIFHMPLWPENFIPNTTDYTLLLGLSLLGAALAALGVFARPALFAAAAIGLFCFFCDRLQYHNNRYQLLLLSALVAVTPCDRSFRLVRLLRVAPSSPLAPSVGGGPAGTAPRWSVRLVAAQLSIVYLASSLGKLFDSDWRGGTVLLLRFATSQPYITKYTPDWFAQAWSQVVPTPWFSQLAAVVAIASELFLAVGPWLPRTRPLALWLGVMFHIGIEASARVELFSYTMLSGYLVFVTPELRERALSWNTARPGGRYLAPLFERLDLFARFKHQRAVAQSELLVARDRQGRQHHGLAAWRELARAMPPLFPLWLPLALVTLRRRPPSAR